MEKSKETALRCVTVLTVIAVVCGVLLAVLYPILYVKPSVDSISENVKAEELGLNEGTELKWTIEDLNESAVKGKGGEVIMAASAKTESEEYYGLLIRTGKDGKLQECRFAFYFRKSDSALLKAIIVEDGATSGRDFEYAKANDKLKNVRSFEDYYLSVTDTADKIYGEFDTPKCGATKTVTAVDNAFRIAADYYYKTYGGSGK